MGYADLIKNQQDLFTKVSKEIDKANKGDRQYETDERYWKPTLDAQKNGSAKLRFLPGNTDTDPDAIPFAKLITHFWQDKGGTYAQNSLTTFGQKDPSQEKFWELWNAAGGKNTAKDAPGKDKAKKFSGKESYIFCIYVIEDKLNPAAEGKVWLWKGPKTVWNILNEAMFPTDGSTPVNPYDMINGATLELKIKQKAGMTNYESSRLLDCGPMIATKDGEPNHKRMEAVYNIQHSVRAEVAPEKFKSYEELEALVNKALGIDTTPVQRQAPVQQTAPKTTAPKTVVTAPKEEAPFDTDEDEVVSSKEETSAPAPAAADDEDEDAAFFANLRREAAQ